MSSDGSNQHQITHLGGSATFPNYSPNGSRLAFGGYAHGGSKNDIYIVKADGTHLVRLTKASGDNDQPKWSPDGKYIAFLSTRTGVAQVWRMNADGSNQTQLTTNHRQHSGLDWSPDGSMITYDEGEPGNPTAIWKMRQDGTVKVVLTHSSTRDFAPAWSPDGRKIVFIRLFGASKTATQSIYVMNADGSHQRALHPGGKQLVPSWQPVR